jgi:23S rRNA pseudouridine1911/1915/1917 synthase
MMNPIDDDLIEVSDQEQNIDFIVDVEHNKERIDKYLTSTLEDMSRSYIQKLIGEERVFVDGKAVKSNFRVVSGGLVTLCMPEVKEAQIAPEDIALDIIYEDADIIVINKHKGLVVHPAPGHESGTLVNALLYHCKDNLSGINGVLRPGIVHRIDRDTTGVIIACKNDIAHRFVAEQLKEHSITRRYQAIVYNTLKTDSGRVEATIGRHPKDRKKMAVNVRNGKSAATNYHLIENLSDKYAYIECELETGRTHQIRVHMASINHPILGDIVYGPDKNPYHLEGQALHAGILGLIHPRTKEYMEFTAPLPEYFTDLLTRLRRL